MAMRMPFTFGGIGRRNIPQATSSSGFSPNNLALKAGTAIVDQLSGKRQLMMRQATQAIDASTRLAENDLAQKQLMDLIPGLKQNDVLSFGPKRIDFMTEIQKSGRPQPKSTDSGTPSAPTTEDTAPEGSTAPVQPVKPTRKKRKAGVTIKDISAAAPKMTDVGEFEGQNTAFDATVLRAKGGDTAAQKRLARITKGLGTKPAFPAPASGGSTTPKKNGNVQAPNGNKKRARRAGA